MNFQFLISNYQTKKTNPGFTLIELMLVIVIVIVLGVGGWQLSINAGRGQELANERHKIAAVLREAQQRAIGQVEGVEAGGQKGQYWGVVFENSVSGNPDRFLTVSAKTLPPAAPFPITESLVTLKSSVEFQTPTAGNATVIYFDQVTGDLFYDGADADTLNDCDQGTASDVTIKIGIAVEPTETAEIKIFCNGRIEF